MVSSSALAAADACRPATVRAEAAVWHGTVAIFNRGRVFYAISNVPAPRADRWGRAC